MFINIIKGILKGKSLARILMNLELKKYIIKGDVLDIGGGKNPSYYNFLQIDDNAEIVNVDLKSMNIDLEKDKLPANDNSVDCILIFNVLEHIYNYDFLMSEAKRVLKKEGVLLGFVPFLVNYHPDPHDYFRYTNEALEKIFFRAGFEKIEIKRIGRGPFAVNYNNINPSLPTFLNLFIFPFYYFLDYIFIKIRPKIIKRYPLGYVFYLTK